MKTIQEIKQDLKRLINLYEQDSEQQEIANIFRRRLDLLSSKETAMITTSYSFENFTFLVPYIQSSFNIYRNKDIFLTLEEKEELIIQYIFSYDQILLSTEDQFETLEDQSDMLFGVDQEGDSKHDQS